MTSQPDFLDSARQMVRERRVREERGRSENVPLNILVSWTFSRLIARAAQHRGMNKSAYTRRALAVFIARDLDLPLGSVLSYCLMPVPYAGRLMFGNHGAYVDRPRDDGTGIEVWCAHPGCDGTHLREAADDRSGR